MTREEMLAWASEGLGDTNELLTLEGNPPRPKETKMQKPDTMDLATWVRAMSSGDRDKSKADLMIASQLLADARAGVQATIGQSAPDDLRAVAQLLETMSRNLADIREMVLKRMRDDANTWPRDTADRPVLLDEDAQAKIDEVRRGEPGAPTECYVAARKPTDGPEVRRMLRVASLGDNDVGYTWM